MRINNYQPPKSSFLAIEKDMGIIVDLIFRNERLKKLLYYTTNDALSKPNLTPEETASLFGKQIKIVPKLYVDDGVLNYLIINFDNFIESENPEFRTSFVEFDIICHFDQWHLTDFSLRPYKIAAELDSLLDKKKLTGIGELHFIGANQMVLTDEFAGLCLMYEAIHGGEDKIKSPNYNEDSDIAANLKDLMDLSK